MTESLIYLSEALPVSGRALHLRSNFNCSLIDSFIYLLEACEEAVSSSLYFKAKQKLSSLKVNLKFSGLLSAVHADFFKATEKQNVNEITFILKQLLIKKFQIIEIKFINLSQLNSYYFNLVREISSQEIIEEIKFFQLSLEEFKEVKKFIKRGLHKLEKISLDFYKEFQELIGEIIILNAQGVKQGSSSDLMGVIYKSYQHKWEKLTDILEFIIHEQSHLYVHLLNKDDSLVLNPSDKYESPLRKEKRPLMGIYHATFVLARVHYVLTKALSLKEIPEDEIDYCRELLDYYKKRYFVGYDVLKEHAQMTPLGAGLIESSRKLLS